MDEFPECNLCDGDGYVETISSGLGFMARVCERCKGTGSVWPEQIDDSGEYRDFD